jgi:hypothetical protein
MSEGGAWQAFLTGSEVPSDLDDESARALVEALVERSDAARLQALAGSAGTRLAKEARRGLHRLRSRGVAAPTPKAPGAAVEPVRAATERPEVWASSPDGAGERLVSAVLPAAGGGWDVLHVRISDETGLLEAVRAQGPKKMWRELHKRFQESNLVFAEVPLAYGSWLVEEAYQRTVSTGRSPPPGFAAIHSLLPASERPARHPAEELLRPSPGPAEPAKLHALPDLRSWIPNREILSVLRLRLEEIEASQLLVDDRQRREARLAAIDRAIETTFEGEARGRWRRRLLDAAHVYLRAGRLEDAAGLLMQADRLGQDGFTPHTDPFCRALVEKLLPPELTGGRIETTFAP